MREIIAQIKIGFLLLIIFIVLTGLIYPMLVTAIAQLIFPWQANGSLIEQNSQIVGSQLIGQYFDAPNYFWGRPSATTPYQYNSASSAGSNLGPTNPILFANVQHRIANLKKFDPQNTLPIPIDLVTASGSGLDPDISPQAAFYQVSRIAQARHLSEDKLADLIRKQIIKRSFGLLGEPRVNVLKLNLLLTEEHSG